MAKVRCPCGRQYNVADDLLGKLVKCAACGKSFKAQAARPAPAPAAPKPPRRKTPGVRKLRVGDLAVQRGLISREHLDACLEYQMACADVAGTDDRRLGQVLLAGGLLTAEQFDEIASPDRVMRLGSVGPLATGGHKE